MKNTGRLVRETCLSFTVCVVNSFISAVILSPTILCTCVSVNVCVCARQVTSSPLKWNAIVDPFFQISFPNLELCTATEHAVSLVLLESVKKKSLLDVRIWFYELKGQYFLFFLSQTQHRDL